MSHLQLADNGLTPRDASYMPPAALLEYMVQIPREDGGFVWVREDQLDDLPLEALYQVLQQQPHLSGLKEMFARMKARRSERKDQKAIEKQAGKEDRFAWRESKRTERSGRKGGSFVERITGAAGDIVGRIQGQPQGRGAEDFFPQITGQASVGVAQWWQNPIILGVGALAVIGGTIYLVSKNKK